MKYTLVPQPRFQVGTRVRIKGVKEVRNVCCPICKGIGEVTVNSAVFVCAECCGTKTVRANFFRIADGAIFKVMQHLDGDTVYFVTTDEEIERFTIMNCGFPVYSQIWSEKQVEENLL